MHAVNDVTKQQWKQLFSLVADSVDQRRHWLDITGLLHCYEYLPIAHWNTSVGNDLPHHYSATLSDLPCSNYTVLLCSCNIAFCRDSSWLQCIDHISHAPASSEAILAIWRVCFISVSIDRQLTCRVISFIYIHHSWRHNTHNSIYHVLFSPRQTPIV